MGWGGASMLDLADMHYRIRLAVCSLRQNNPVILYSALLFGPMIAGWAIMETTNPGIVNMESKKCGYDRSLMSRMMDAHYPYENLNTQYRMHPKTYPKSERSQSIL